MHYPTFFPLRPPVLALARCLSRSVVATNVGAVFQKLLAFETAGGSLTASTFVSIGGENVTVATGGGAVKLSAFAVNALNVTTCADVESSAGKCGTANIAVLLLGLDPLSFEGISLPEDGVYVYVCDSH